jgi:DNA adenine methylase
MDGSLALLASRRYGSLSPLRYPGGKAALAGVFADTIADLHLSDPTYVEPYAGGAGAGVALLRQGLVSHLVINDLDPAVHAFWASVVDDNEAFLRLLDDTPLTVPEWRHQREIYRAADTTDRLGLGFAFFYLNRTNRSGVLSGGVIGGLQQTGKDKIGARFPRATLRERLTAVGAARQNITVSNRDGRDVISDYGQDENVFMYIDPPYVRAGSMLYLNAFDEQDHRDLAGTVRGIPAAHWLLTYDIAPLVEELYEDQFMRTYELHYSNRHRRLASEWLVASRSVAQALMRQSTAARSA